MANIMRVRTVRVLSAVINRELDIEVRDRGGPKDQTESGEKPGPADEEQVEHRARR